MAERPVSLTVGDPVAIAGRGRGGVSAVFGNRVIIRTDAAAEVEITANRLRPAPGAAPLHRDTAPYVMWKCCDGREVLANRAYRPIWTRLPGHTATPADPEEFVSDITAEFWPMPDRDPWDRKEDLAAIHALLGRFVSGQPIDVRGMVHVRHGR